MKQINFHVYAMLMRRLCVLVVALALPLGVAAQTPSSADAAITAAARWLAVADADQPKTMWNQSAPLMKNKETEVYWVGYIAAMRGALGAPAGPKTWVGIDREIDNPSLPPGEFVSVLFISTFSKTRAWEKVALVKDGNQWLPVGYQYGALPAGPASATSPAAPATAK